MEAFLTIEPLFERALRDAGLDRFERVMAIEAPPGSVTRAVPGRSTARIEIPGGAAPGGEPLAVYLKRYRGRWPAPAAARREWRMLREASAAGIPCPEPVAFGERRGLLSARESFLMTREIAGAVQADWWLEKNRDRRADLIAGVASLARRFHRQGFHHRDLYLCHFFVRDGAAVARPAAALDLFLIDLQRCARLGLLARRWLVKDLAQLRFSMAQAGLGPADWEEFLEAYGPVGPGMRAAILRKWRRIAAHVPRYG